MKRRQLLFLAFLSPTLLFASFNRYAFRQGFGADLNAPFSFKEDVRDKYHFLFVGGFLGESVFRWGGYFSDITKELRRLGIPKKQIHVIFPPSSEYVEENATNFVFDHLIALMKQKSPNQKLVIYAHSKGAAEILFFALLCPELIEQHVEAIFFDQGAFGGTSISDYMTGVPQTNVPWTTRFFFPPMKVALRVLNAIGGLESMTHEEGKRRYEALSTVFKHQYDRIKSRLTFLTFYSGKGTTPFYLRHTHAHIAATSPPDTQSDAVIAIADQTLALAGLETLGQGLRRDHFDCIRLSSMWMGNFGLYSRWIARGILKSLSVP